MIRDEPRGTRGARYDWTAARALYDTGITGAELCRTLGCRYRTFTKARARLGWPVRRPAQAEAQRARMAALHAERRAA